MGEIQLLLLIYLTLISTIQRQIQKHLELSFNSIAILNELSIPKV